MPKLLFIMLVFSVLSACMKKIDETLNWSANKFYLEAHKSLVDGDYPGAIEYFEKLQGRFPYSKQARQADIEIIYAYYKYDETDSALVSANRFIEENPEHQHLDYVYYLRAVTQYEKGSGTLYMLFPQDIAYLGFAHKQKSYDYFNQVVELFPNSIYYQDSLLRVAYLKSKLAENELNIAKFYFDRQAYIAAINRCKEIIKNYPQTKAQIEALMILDKSYLALGYPDIAKQYRNILATNNLQNYQVKIKPQPLVDRIIH